jgi:hypothetical protein
MSTTSNRVGFWNDQVWVGVDSAVTGAHTSIRVAQNVFKSTQLTGVTSVPHDVFDPAKMSIEEGETRPYVELVVEFSLTNGQVNADQNGVTVTALAPLAVRSLALAEDIVILRGTRADLPHNVYIESGKDAAKEGILDLVVGDPIVVNPPDPGTPTNSGGEIFLAIAEGLGQFMNSQPKPFALIEDKYAFAATTGSLLNGAPLSATLNPLLTCGIHATDAMPPYTGLLVATGGDPTMIYYDSDPMTEPTVREQKGGYRFRIFERIQFVARDRRAFVKLDFAYLANKRAGKNKVGNM